MRPVNGELQTKLDSKTAKTGDSVVVKTKDSVKTGNGTEIPKGSKLMGRVVAVQARGQGSDNSKLAIEFDHAQLKGGQNLPIHSVIKSLTQASDTAASVSDVLPMGSMPSSGGSMGGGRPGSATSANGPAAGVTPSVTPGVNQTGSTGNGPAAGTVVGKMGDEPIRTTAVPGVFLASDESGQTSGEASGTLFAAKANVHLDQGTKMVLDIAPAATQ